MMSSTELARGIRAFNKGRYEEAHRVLEPLAHSGELRAQLIVARLYYAGNGVEQSDSQYRYWLEQCAANGDKSSRARLKKLRKQGEPE